MSTVIAGYRILATLGQGGMATVYRATQIAIDREVALKILVPTVAGDRALADRFLREAKAMGAINHPNVLTIHDAGHDGHALYIALELMTGGDADGLRQQSGGRLAPWRALEIVRDAAAGAAALHAAGLLHRDIKPANIFLSADGRAKLADLGLARAADGTDALTNAGSAVGTPAFMAPEQASGVVDLDGRADVYSLGATLFALLVGRQPYQGPTPYAILAQVLNEPPPDAPELPGALRTVIRTAMAKDRTRRYAGAKAFIAALDGCLPAVGAVSPAVIANRPPSARSAPPQRRARRARVWWPVPLAVIAVLGIGSWVALTHPVRNPTAPAPAQPTGKTAPPPVIRPASPIAAPAFVPPAVSAVPVGPWRPVALANAGFDAERTQAVGWTIAGAGVAVIPDGETGNALRVTFHTNDAPVRISQRIAVDPAWVAVRFSCRVRSTLGVVRTGPQAVVAAEFTLSGAPAGRADLVWRTADLLGAQPFQTWQPAVADVPHLVPAGYRTLTVALTLADVKAILDLDSIVVEAAER